MLSAVLKSEIAVIVSIKIIYAYAFFSDLIKSVKEEIILIFSYTVAINPPDESFNVSRTISQKEYEVKDHLGNVRLVFSDMKDVNFGALGRHRYNIDIRAVNNYYPYGMLMPDMSWQSSGYRYGFGGQ